MRTNGAQLSRFLSLVLRHRPDELGIALDAAGWVRVDELLAALAARGKPVARAELDAMVATNPKQRFEFDAAGECIRARQGHSVAVELGYAPSEPPELLYHGTVASALPAIRRDGLLRMQRHAVHLSADVATAERVGGRRGEAVILVVHARRLAATGVPFARTDNGVWLVERVPPEFVVFPGGA